VPLKIWQARADSNVSKRAENSGNKACNKNGKSIATTSHKMHSDYNNWDYIGEWKQSSK